MEGKDKVYLFIEGRAPSGYTVDRETYEIVRAELEGGRKEIDVVRELIASGYAKGLAMSIVLGAKHDNGRIQEGDRYAPVSRDQ